MNKLCPMVGGENTNNGEEEHFLIDKICKIKMTMRMFKAYTKKYPVTIFCVIAATIVSLIEGDNNGVFLLFDTISSIILFAVIKNGAARWYYGILVSLLSFYFLIVIPGYILMCAPAIQKLLADTKADNRVIVVWHFLYIYFFALRAAGRLNNSKSLV